MKTICNNGEGGEKNPCQKYVDPDFVSKDWIAFEKNVQFLPVYDQSGKLFTGSGEFEAELIEQHKRWEDIDWCEAHNGRRQTHIGLENRQIYRLIDHIQPTDQEKEEIKTSEKINSSAITRRFERTFLPHGGNPPDIEKLEPGEEESVEEAAQNHADGVYLSLRHDNPGRDRITSSAKFDFECGAKWQKSQSNLIEKEKVIELLEAEMVKSQYLHDLNNLLTKIKEL